MIFIVMLVSACVCDSFKTKVRTKVRRKVDSFNYGNKIPENERVVKNFTDTETGRGFLPGK